MGGMALSVSMALGLFEVPLRGSFWVLVLAFMLFLVTALGMGLFISVLAKNQFIAGMIAIIATFLPAFLLSGMLFDIGYADGITPALAVPEAPVPNGSRAG